MLLRRNFRPLRCGGDRPHPQNQPAYCPSLRADDPCPRAAGLPSILGLLCQAPDIAHPTLQKHFAALGLTLPMYSDPAHQRHCRVPHACD